MQVFNAKLNKLSVAISATVAIGFCSVSNAEEDTAKANIAPIVPFEELVVIGRLQSGAGSIIDERINQTHSADILSFEQMVRIGDPDVASALKRVTGLTLVDGKFIYIRGLGERYSNTLLNGVVVPSPELTRNVIPLDLLPTSIVNDVKVQKAYSADLPGHFGGGNINIRTKTAPDQLKLSFSVSTGSNSENSDDGLAFPSGGDNSGLPTPIADAITEYRGNIGASNIVTLRDTDNIRSSQELLEAAQINRDLMLSLDRNIAITQKSLTPDFGVKFNVGNLWEIGDDVELGAQVIYSYDNKWRNRNQKKADIGSPSEHFSEVKRTVEETKQIGGLNVGLSYGSNHTIDGLFYKITSDENQASITSGFNTNKPFGDDSQALSYFTRFEERTMEIAQLLGEHTFEFNYEVLDSATINWVYSDSTAETEIPNQSTIQANNDVTPSTSEVLSTNILATSSAAVFDFVELEDQVESLRGDLLLPFIFGLDAFDVSVGFLQTRKAREYYDYQVNINTIGVSSEALAGTPSEVFTDANLLSDPRFNATVGGGLGAESYVAAQTSDAVYAMADLTLGANWRFNLGLRWEDFKRAVLAFDPLDFSGQLIERQLEELQTPGQRISIQEDGLYPSLAVTYINEGLMNTDTFQIRLNYAETVVRPELREVSNSQYIDPLLNVRVQGNSSLESADINHIDLRFEWFYSEANFTASLFYKDISNPIETARTPGSDDNIILEFFNGESGEVSGIELEAYYPFATDFFVSSNLTLSDSEIKSSESVGFTNPTRAMTGHSDLVFNSTLGYDSNNGRHAASLALNHFSERLFYAAKLQGHDDAYEQPFTALDASYSFYPSESFTISLKAKNLLDEQFSIEQISRVADGIDGNEERVRVLEQNNGSSLSLSVKYEF